jgi:hypothetical protein
VYCICNTPIQQCVETADNTWRVVVEYEPGLDWDDNNYHKDTAYQLCLAPSVWERVRLGDVMVFEWGDLCYD